MMTEQRLIQIYREYNSMINGIAYNYFGNHSDAEDIAGSVWVKVLCGKIADSPALKATLIRVTMTTCSDVAKYRRRRREHQEAIEYEFPDREQPVYPESRRFEINDLIKALTPQQRMCVVMRYIEQLKPNDISTRIGISPDTVRVLCARAIHRMKLAVET